MRHVGLICLLLRVCYCGVISKEGREMEFQERVRSQIGIWERANESVFPNGKLGTSKRECVPKWEFGNEPKKRVSSQMGIWERDNPRRARTTRRRSRNKIKPDSDRDSDFICLWRIYSCACPANLGIKVINLWGLSCVKFATSRRKL